MLRLMLIFISCLFLSLPSQAFFLELLYGFQEFLTHCEKRLEGESAEDLKELAKTLDRELRAAKQKLKESGHKIELAKFLSPETKKHLLKALILLETEISTRAEKIKKDLETHTEERSTSTSDL